jgi:hypothetical protein
MRQILKILTVLARLLNPTLGLFEGYVCIGFVPNLKNHSHVFVFFKFVNIYCNTVKYYNSGFFKIFYALYSTLLHRPPLRFHCVGGFWDRT